MKLANNLGVFLIFIFFLRWCCCVEGTEHKHYSPQPTQCCIEQHGCTWWHYLPLWRMCILRNNANTLAVLSRWGYDGLLWRRKIWRWLCHLKGTFVCLYAIMLRIAWDIGTCTSTWCPTFCLTWYLHTQHGYSVFVGGTSSWEPMKRGSLSDHFFFLLFFLGWLVREWREQKKK